MKRLFCALAALLGACDANDGTVITLLDLNAGYQDSVFTAVGEVVVESHNEPFLGMDGELVASLLQMPGRFPANIRFKAQAPGDWGVHNPFRLVLVFNGADAPGVRATCSAKEPLPGLPPKAEGYTVYAVLCEGEDWLATGRMEARNVKDGDAEAFTRTMRLLFSRMFDEKEAVENQR